MITDPRKVFKCLDEELDSRGNHYSLVITGGAVIALTMNTRVTGDVDVVLGDLDEVIMDASNKVADRMGLRHGWLNKSASVFNGNFSQGWESRTEKIFQGKNLIVSSVSKDDFIRSKYFTFLNRGTDIDDLVFLKPDRKTIIKLMKEAFKGNKVAIPKHDIAFDTDELLRKLNYEGLDDTENQ